MEMKAPFFSIIMPVYNAEKYLIKAVNSILKQKFMDYEILLIDDCSKDRSLEICLNFAKNDRRIKVLRNKLNSGVSVSRNKGLKEAMGLYCGYVDADDYIEQGLLQKAYDALIESKAEILKFGVYEEYYSDEDSLITIKKVNHKGFFSKNKELIRAKSVALELEPLFGYMCNGFYLNKYKIEFNPKIRINEDFDYNIRYLKKAISMQYIEYLGYHYVKRANNSLSTTPNSNYYQDHMRKIQGYIDLYGNISNMPIDVRSNVFWLYTRFIYSTLKRLNSKTQMEEVWKNITNDKYYELFRKTQFVSLSFKQTVLTYNLKINHKISLLFMVELMRVVENKLPGLFLRLKR